MLDLTRLDEAIRYEGGVSRRLFLAYAAALYALPETSRRVTAQAAKTFPSDPFTAGIASGDPTESSVVLWTRLAPRPLELDGGMPKEAVEVVWEIANDEGMKKIIHTGKVAAIAENGHTVHAEVEGLKSDRWYHYRFRAGDAVSPVGRTRTMPAKTDRNETLRFAYASCQHFEAGLFTAYEHMAKENLDLIVHLGDYIYENSGKDTGVRKHHGKEVMTAAEYRTRYAQYRTDEHLRAAHAICPWLVTWDDHEVDNNYAGEYSEKPDVTPAEFLTRRAGAYQAYYDMMPLRRTSIPKGPNLQLYRTLNFGALAEIQMLDTRQYRSDQVNGDVNSELNDAAWNPKNTIMGHEQFSWLKKSLTSSKATWNVLAQQVLMAMVDRKGGKQQLYGMDKWTGYAHERKELMTFLAERKINNAVVLTGDIHSNWVNDLRIDDRRPTTPVVATEFVGTSISSGGDGKALPTNHANITAENPCVKFYNGERGYVRCTVTPKTWHTDYRVVEEVTKPGAKIHTRASFVVTSGRPGAKKA